MGDKYYACSKFTSAVRHLATYDGPRRDALRGAWQHFLAASADDMPSLRVAEDFRKLQKRLTWAEDTTGEGKLPATLRLIDDNEARSIADAIVDIWYELNHAIIEAQKQGESWNMHHKLADQDS